MVNSKSLKKSEAIQFLAKDDNIKKLCAKDAMIKPVFLYPEDNVQKILKN